MGHGASGGTDEGIGRRRSAFTEAVRRLLLRYAACWVVLLASLALLPMLGWVSLRYGVLPDPLGPLLLFWPQYLFMPNGVVSAAAMSEAPRGEWLAPVVAALFWSLAVGGYVWATRAARSAWVYVGVVPTVYVVLQAAVYPLLSLLGFAVVIDGP